MHTGHSSVPADVFFGHSLEYSLFQFRSVPCSGSPPQFLFHTLPEICDPVSAGRLQSGCKNRLHAPVNAILVKSSDFFAVSRILLVLLYIFYPKISCTFREFNMTIFTFFFKSKYFLLIYCIFRDTGYSSYKRDGAVHFSCIRLFPVLSPDLGAPVYLSVFIFRIFFFQARSLLPRKV